MQIFSKKIAALTAILFTLVLVAPLNSEAQLHHMASNFWSPNGSVTDFAIDPSNGDAYLAGQFNYVAPSFNAVVKIAKTDASVSPSFPQLSGVIKAIEPDGLGGFFVGGNFFVMDQAGGYQHLLHLQSDGTLDLGWVANASFSVNSLKLDRGILYVGGEFNNIGGQLRPYLAALNAADGIATAWNPAPNYIVSAIDVDATDVYIAGGFTSIGANGRRRLASIDKTTATVNAWNPDVTGTSVNQLILDGTEVYVSGVFDDIGGVPRLNIAQLDKTSGAVNAGWDASLIFGTINSLAINASTLYVGGSFSIIGGQVRRNIAGLSKVDGTADSFAPNTDGMVTSLDLDGTNLYTVGTFVVIGGQNYRHAASVDTTTGIVNSWIPNISPSFSGFPSVIQSIGSNVILGGNGNIYYNGEIRNFLAKITGSTGTLAPWNPNPQASVNSIALDSTEIYVGGDFVTVGGQPRLFLGALNKTSGAATTWAPSVNAPVSAVKEAGASTVYIGGSFTLAGGEARNSIAALDKTTGLASSFDPNADGSISGISVTPTNIYTWGTFANIGGQARQYLAALDPISGLASAWDPSPDNSFVNDLAIDGANIYIGGAFGTIGGQSRSNAAAVDATSGLAKSWNPQPDAQVTSILIDATNVTIGGLFATVNSSPGNQLSKINKVTGIPTAYNPTGTTYQFSYYNKIGKYGNKMYAGGVFDYYFGENSSRKSNFGVFELPLVNFTTPVQTFAENAGAVNLNISLISDVQEDVTVDYTVNAGTASPASDFVLSAGTLTIPANQTSATIPLTIIDDINIEVSETFSVTLSNPINAYLGTTPIQTITITDNDIAPPLPPPPAPVQSGAGGGNFGNPSCSGAQCLAPKGNLPPPSLPAPIIPEPPFTPVVPQVPPIPVNPGQPVLPQNPSPQEPVIPVPPKAPQQIPLKNPQTPPKPISPLANPNPVKNLSPAKPPSPVVIAEPALENSPMPNQAVAPNESITSESPGSLLMKISNDTNACNVEFFLKKYGLKELKSFTDTDHDGLADVIECQIGTNPLEKDTDIDTISDGDEVLNYQTDPNVRNNLPKNLVKIVNYTDGQKTSDRTLYIKGVAPAGETVQVIISDANARAENLGVTVSDAKSIFAINSGKELRDGEYFLQAISKHPETGKVLISKQIKIIIDTTLGIKNPEIKQLSDQKVTDDVLLKNLRIEIYDHRPILLGTTDFGNTVTADWKSIVTSSAVIADAASGDFRIASGNVLEPGEHSVYITAIRNRDHAQSDTIRLDFIIGNKSFIDRVLELWWVFLLLLFAIIGRQTYHYQKNKISPQPLPPQNFSSL